MNYSALQLFLAAATFITIQVSATPNPTKTSNVTYHFLQTAGASEDTATHQISKTADGYSIHYCDTKQNITIAECTSEYHMISWHFINKKKKIDITVTRNNTELHVKGIHKGKNVDRMLEIDSLPWLQVLEFSLPPYAENTSPVTQFWILRPTDFSAHKMKLRKMGDKSSDPPIEKGKIQLVMSPYGISERFWKATMTVSTETDSFVSSVLPAFFPGKPAIVQTLLSAIANK